MARQEEERAKIADLRRKLIEWYERNKRALPWRERREPYAIWVSEIMLQQTRVAVVVERYRAFMKRFPTLVALALAPEDDVLALWSGLGYYRRARMLHKAAQFVASHEEGNLPETADELRKLPGIGAYTAAAIASIAHGEPVAVVDGNVERVLCRLAGWEMASRQGKTATRRRVEQLAARLVDPARPGDFNQAMMELGAMVCTPRGPQCLVCPVAGDCKTQGEHKTLPRPKMLSREVAYALSVRIAAEPARQYHEKLHGKAHEKALLKTLREVLLEQRPQSASVMPGMWELPALRSVNVPQEELRMTVRHAIMQVNYYVRIRTVFEDDVDALTTAGGERRWIPLQLAGEMALTGLARKVLTRAHLLPRVAADAIAPEQGMNVV